MSAKELSQLVPPSKLDSNGQFVINEFSKKEHSFDEYVLFFKRFKKTYQILENEYKKEAETNFKNDVFNWGSPDLFYGQKFRDEDFNRYNLFRITIHKIFVKLQQCEELESPFEGFSTSFGEDKNIEAMNLIFDENEMENYKRELLIREKMRNRRLIPKEANDMYCAVVRIAYFRIIKDISPNEPNMEEKKEIIAKLKNGLMPLLEDDDVNKSRLFLDTVIKIEEEIKKK